MTRTRFVEDLAPGDRISVDGLRAVVRTTTPTGTDQHLVELVNSSDDRDAIVLGLGTKVEIL
ncbi:hypothetical protein ACPXCG_10705 [Gordonia sp. DT218]|uniref:hypothetical protein n=1 Tax=unclassified Gordonia (in: high G+C Gram-positive bacteria) TaxID=2657482 RepID=UPI00226DAE70|nr:hypothetical protein [Gordonia sp. SL306]WAC55912.1 hypothetical protein OVA31_01150 [Gordonia sp. SL306]